MDLSAAPSTGHNHAGMRTLRAVTAGTLVVGTLDLLDAILFFGFRNGVPPGRILQSIASGWLGRAAFRGGMKSAMLGLATHYFIAFTIVVTYGVASRRLNALTRHPWIWGSLYGVAVYFFMNLVVVPLSAIGPQPFVIGPFVNGVLIHLFGIGIPSALFAAAARRQEHSTHPGARSTSADQRSFIR